MLWYTTAEMLESRHFGRLTCNHEEINFFYKNIEDKVSILALVDTTRRYYYEKNAFLDLQNELERKFLLRGAKEVSVLFIVFTNNVPYYRQAFDDNLQFWIVDTTLNRLMIFENQPEDFLGLKNDIEKTITAIPKKTLKSKRFPVITATLVLINIIVFLFTDFFYSPLSNQIFDAGANRWTNVFYDHQYYRLFTCMFLHAGINHLLNNMLTLSVLGYQIENKLGRLRFLALYIICGVLSSLASALYYMNYSYNSNTIVSSVGASGAIFGVFGAFIVIALIQRSVNGTYISIPKIILVTALLLYSGFMTENVDNTAHLAGIIIGSIITLIYCKCDKSILK